MAKIYVAPELGTKVQQLRHYFDVVTASNKGIIMLARDDWNKVCEYISKVDEELLRKDVVLDLLEAHCLWAECFWVCGYDNDAQSFHAIAHHHTFMSVCRACKVQPILLETCFSIPHMLSSDVCCVKPQGSFNFEIEVEDN